MNSTTISMHENRASAACIACLQKNSERSSSIPFLVGMDANPLPAGMRAVTQATETTT
ncbi:hypothetical protein [Novipirellula aureliae]|uniref:hypothetical protein n=1 Tax=Novipirellula aureliae TaxID=2527966 RepID=UPI0018CE2084|nr:hypothetical protein [Novipirellula aureliae]